MTWVLDNLDLIGTLTVEHLRQSVPPILLGLVFALPIGWLAYRYRPTRGLILGSTGLLYTIPSLALFAILPPLLGISFLSEANLIIAMTIYAVAIMTRSVSDALSSVSPDVRNAATGMGYGSWRRFWAVELPLAGPVILAGLRVTAVSTISLVTVGILIGVQNLGYLFTNGLQRRIIPEVLAGVIAVMAIALLIDFLLAAMGRRLMPWAPGGRQRRASSTALEAS